jgi:hypothetical protein
MARVQNHPVGACLLAAAFALLVLVAPAAAEVRSGEATSPANPAISGEADFLGATASYDSTTGFVSVTTTTRVAPLAEDEESNFVLVAVLGVSKGDSCERPEISFPVLGMQSTYQESSGVWLAADSEEEESIPTPEPVVKSVAGTTTTLAAASGSLIDKPYDCVAVAVIPQSEEGEPQAADELTFPIAVKSPPPPPTPPADHAVQGSNPPPPPPTMAGRLSIAKAKPVKARSGKWTKVKFKLSNTGGTAIWPVKLKIRRPSGLIVKPAKTALPALLPGQSWTVAFRVKLTAKAKPKSKISLIATATGITTKGAAVVTASSRRPSPHPAQVSVVSAAHGL